MVSQFVMAQYSTYQSNAAEIPIMRKWLLRALVLSLLIHAVLFVFFNFKKLDNFGTAVEDRPAIFMKLKQVTITEPLETEVKSEQKPKAPVAPIKIEESKPIADELQFKPSAPEVSPLVPEKPKQVDLSGFDAFDKNPGNSVAALEKQLSGMSGAILEKSVKMPNQPRIQLPNGPKGGEGGAGRDGGIPGRATLDDALGKTGVVVGKPIAVQGGALFEWGKAELLPQAILNLQKLGQLIRLNPKATFIISGHTDHTGTHETNLMLSQQRADAVRDWLVSNLGIDPMRITTIGKADDDAFPELGPDKSIEEQAPNRRVEIVIRTRGK
jgi:outer membrane protein OmpA-like peptidoglycan-associated protein